MRPFNLEEAKAGKAVCTRDGRDVRIICFDVKNKEFPIAALIKLVEGEFLCQYMNDGRYSNKEPLEDYDLVMKTEKKTGWINIYPNNNCSSIHLSKETADARAQSGRIYCTQIEWEE